MALSGEVGLHCYRVQRVLGRARVQILTGAEAKIRPIVEDSMLQYIPFTLYVKHQILSLSEKTFPHI